MAVPTPEMIRALVQGRAFPYEWEGVEVAEQTRQRLIEYGANRHYYLINDGGSCYSRELCACTIPRTDHIIRVPWFCLDKWTL